MLELEIYYDDLTPEAQCAFDTKFGPPETFNHESVPLFVFSQEESLDREGD